MGPNLGDGGDDGLHGRVHGVEGGGRLGPSAGASAVNRDFSWSPPQMLLTIARNDE